MKALTNVHGEAVSARDKVAHNHEQVDKLRTSLSKELADHKARYMHDRKKDPAGATSPNMPAIDAKYIEDWEDRVRAVEVSSRLPMVVNADAMRRFIEELNRVEAAEKRKVTPLHLLEDLAEFGLGKLGPTRYGMAWMNTHLVVVVATNGQVRIYLRWMFDEPILDALNVGDVSPITPEPAVNYTAAELDQLLIALRIREAAAPLEADLESEGRLPVEPAMAN